MNAAADQPVVAQDYVERVAKALDAALARTLRAEGENGPLAFDLPSDRLVLFSDLHRGARNGADDFARCEPLYAVALSHYYDAGYSLAVIGDVEELWEERPAAVIIAHRPTLAQEARFQREGRYLRIWGNHDDEWQYPVSVAEHLAPLYGDPPLKVHEGLRLRVLDGGVELGHLLLVHGHQGDRISSTFSGFSRLFVRYVWRPFQRITGLSLNTPATSWSLRAKHNVAMYRWAEKQSKLVLIAGHTHLPVFEAQSYAARILADVIESLDRRELTELPPPAGRARARLERDLERAEAETPLERGFLKPCHFDTGCCCYADGSIVGLELSEGQIRLMRWRPGGDNPEKLDSASLRDVLAAC
jgi:hypothetical protein